MAYNNSFFKLETVSGVSNGNKGLFDKKFVLLLILLFTGLTSALPATNVSFFYSTTCPHCEKVIESGILYNISVIDGVNLEKFEVTSPVNREKYLNEMRRFGIDNGGIPFVVIEREGKFSYLMGDNPVIEDLEDFVLNFKGHEIGNASKAGEDLSLWIIVAAAFIDSINPCAFGVLLFLMAVLLTMGSAKRALKSGMIYTFTIFVVYLAAGFGIMKFASSFLVLDEVKVIVGVVILVMAVFELKDFIWEGKGMSLAIPKGVKPWLEKYARRGTLASLIILGTLVAMVELPCTGGIYLAILSLIVDSGAKGIFYLILYNVIFVLPLILISYFVYRGAKVEVVNGWVQRNKRFMRLGAGIVMIGLGGSLLGWF